MQNEQERKDETINKLTIFLFVFIFHLIHAYAKEPVGPHICTADDEILGSDEKQAIKIKINFARPGEKCAKVTN